MIPNLTPSKTSHPRLAYRPDVDGLRAVAVLAVVLYHYGAPGFSGGFVGVDVFFVISGYLIARIIQGDVAADRFSLLDFYERRLRRIAPALLLMLLVISMASVFLLLPSQLKRFGSSLDAALLSLSNFFFWRQSTYFAPNAQTWPLLHTWSLGIEGQFYLAFPILVWALRRRSLGFQFAVLAVIAVLSLAASQFMLSLSPRSAFFLTPSRIWELMAGCLLALVPGRWLTSSAPIQVLGLALILLSTAYGGLGLPFPGLGALLPVLGAALYIFGGSADSRRTGIWLERAEWVAIGRLSYALYLWHWPLLAIARAHSLIEPGWATKLALLAVTAALSVLSWRFIEQPALKGWSRKRLLLNTGGLGAGLLLLGFWLLQAGGLPNRLPSDVSKTLAEVAAPMACPGTTIEKSEGRLSCALGKQGAASFVVWGDSHAMALAPVVQQAALTKRASGRLDYRSACAPLIGVDKRYDPACRAANEMALAEALRPEVRTVVLSARWAAAAEGRVGEAGPLSLQLTDGDNTAGKADNHQVFTRGLERTLARLRQAGKSIIIVDAVPELPFPAPEMFARRRLQGDKGEVAMPAGDFKRRQAFVHITLRKLAQKHGAVVISPAEVLCDAERCFSTRAGKLLFRDEHHLSAEGAMLLLSKIEPLL